MNDELIFVKTSAGEDAVRDRTRLVQRNLRMVLILVDGLTKVSALKQKAGDPAMIETALAELERIGLIESLNSRGERQAASVVEALDSSMRGEHLEPIISSGDTADSPETQDTVFEALIADTSLDSLDADTEIPDIEAPVVRVSPRPTIEPAPKKQGWITSVRNRWLHMREERAFEKAYGTPASDAIPIEAPATSRSTAFRAPRIRLKKLALVAFLVSLLGGMLGIVFYPYDRFRPELEMAASRLMGDDITVRSVGLTLLPKPALKLEDVRLGSDSYVSVRSLLLMPDFRYLLGSGPLFSTASASGIQVQEAALSKVQGWFKAAAVQDAGLVTLDLADLTLQLEKRRFRLATGTLVPNTVDGFSLVGVADGGQLKLEIKPGEKGVTIAARSDKWQMPVIPAIPVDAFDLRGVLSVGRFQIDKFEARSFDGLVTGSGTLEWAGTPSINLSLDLKHVAANRFLEAFRASTLMSGELDGSLRYESASPSMSWLGQSERLEGQVSVARGKLIRIDLAGALKPNLPRGTPQRGGETGFEEFTARVELANNKLAIKGAKLASGLMQASGQAAFDLDSGQVSGVAGVEMRGTVRAPRATIAIGGKASEPELRAGR